MIASRSPRMIFSHKRRLAEPNLPKYVPFVRVDGLMVLPFDIPAQGSFSLEPESTSTATRSTTQTSLSLPASAVLPFAGLSFNRNFSTSQQVSFPLADGDVATHPSASEMLNTSTGVVLHGGAHALVDMDPSILNDDMNFASHGDALAADQMLMPVVGTVGHIMNVNGDPEDQIANTYGDVDAQVALNVNEDGVVSDASYGGAVHADARSQPNATSSLNSSSRDFDFPIPILSLDSVTLDPESEAQGSFTLRVPTRYHHYYLLFLSYTQISSQGSLLQRRQATLKQIFTLIMTVAIQLSVSWFSNHLLLAAAFAILTTCFLIRIFYNLFLSPLSAIPGPWYYAISDFWLTLHILRLRQCKAIQELFEIYGPVVRVGPNKVVFRDVSTMRNVYSVHKFDKSTFYKSLLTYVTSISHIPPKLLTKSVLLSYSNDNDHA